MEKFKATVDGEIGIGKIKVKKGERFTVIRTLKGDCVLITKDSSPNIIETEENLLKIGRLKGTPEIG